MVHRPFRSAALVTCALGIILATLAWSIPAAVAMASESGIQFADIESHLRAESPRARLIEWELEQLLAKRDEALQWSSPELAYDHEEIDSARERQFTLRKHIARPLSRARLNDSWTERLRAERLRGSQAFADLLAESRAGYVRLSLQNECLADLDHLADFVAGISDASVDRHAAGVLSSVDSRLIQLAAFSLRARRHELRREQRETWAAWHADMGLPAGDPVALPTPIEFIPIDLEPLAVYAAHLEENQGLRAKETLAKALGERAEAMRPSLIPSIDVHAGYKDVGFDQSGFVAGLAIELPLFDRGSAVARQNVAEQRRVEDELAIAQGEVDAELAALVEFVARTRSSLASLADHMDEGRSIASALLLAYREGTLSLDAFLNSIQIEAAALTDHCDLLSDYYHSLFRVEALTGTTLVDFDRRSEP